LIYRALASMMLVKVWGPIVVAYRRQRRRSQFVDGALHSVSDTPALVCPRNYFETRHTYFPLGSGELSYWYHRGDLHRADGKPAVVPKKGCKRERTKHALWYTNGMRHTPLDVALRALQDRSMSPRPLIYGGVNKVIDWNGGHVFIDTFKCVIAGTSGPALFAGTSEPAVLTHTSKCAARNHHQCQLLRGPALPAK
jgi:hypothetical protein